MNHDRLYWAFNADERGPAFGPVTDKDQAVGWATAWGDGAFVLGIEVTFAAYPNWKPGGEQTTPGDLGQAGNVEEGGADG